MIFTPNALAIAPLTAEAKVPFVIMNAGASIITVLFGAGVVHALAIVLPAGPMGREDVQDTGQRFRPGP